MVFSSSAGAGAKSAVRRVSRTPRLRWRGKGFQFVEPSALPMKKILLLGLIFFTPFFAHAQAETVWIQPNFSDEFDGTPNNFFPIASTSEVVALENEDTFWFTVKVFADAIPGSYPRIGLGCDFPFSVREVVADHTFASTSQEYLDMLAGEVSVTFELDTPRNPVENCTANSFYVFTSDLGTDGYIRGETAVGENYPYLGWYRNGSPNPVPPEFDPVYLAGGVGVVQINSPENFSTTSSPVNVNFSAYVAEDAQPATYPTHYNMRLVYEATGETDIFVYPLPDFIPGDVFDVATSTPLGPHGNYQMTISLSYLDSSEIYDTYQPVGTPKTVFFAHETVSGVPFGTIGYGGPTGSASDCNVNFLGSDFSLSGCISYIVSPATTTMQNFSSLNLENRFPFAYAYDIGQVRADLFDAPETASTSLSVDVPNFGTITFISRAMVEAVPFGPLIKTILSALLWLFMAEYIYKAILRSHNQNTGI